MNQRVLSIAAMTCLVLTGPFGCGKDRPGQGPAGGRDALLRTQLVGQWDRQWEMGPVGYQRILKADGSAILREFRAPPATAPAGAALPGPTMYHRHYKVVLPLSREYLGTWTVENGDMIYQVALANGHPLKMRYHVERITTTELVESSTGVEGKVEAKFLRWTGAALATKPAAAS